MFVLLVAGEAVAVNEPTTLFATLTDPTAVPAAFTPTMKEPLVPVAVSEIAPVPVALPTMLGVVVPMLAEPLVRLIPVRTPVEVDRAIAEIVLP